MAWQVDRPKWTTLEQEAAFIISEQKGVLAALKVMAQDSDFPRLRNVNPQPARPAKSESCAMILRHDLEVMAQDSDFPRLRNANPEPPHLH